MAIFHFEAQIIARAGGRQGRSRSVIAAAAYRAAERLYDQRLGLTFDYRNKRGVTHREILTPPGTAKWLSKRETLWNHVERLEKRRDAQLARELNIALPHELDAEQRLRLIRDFVLAEFVARGMVADLTLHDPVEGESDARHFHAHVLLTLREAHGGGLSRVKTRGWNSNALLVRWREQWALHANRALAQVGSEARIDHRCLLAQRDDAIMRGDEPAARSLDRLPQIAVGPEALARHVRGLDHASRDKMIRTRRGKMRHRLYTQTDQGSRVAANATILRNNARKAQAYAAYWRWREARLARRRLRWAREAKRRQYAELARDQTQQREKRREAFAALSLVHILYRWGLATKAQVIAARRAAWATLTEAERLEAERRFAKRVERYRQEQVALRRGRRARRRNGP